MGKITLIKSLLVSQLIYAEADLWEFRRWLSFTKIFRCVQFTAYVQSQLSKGFYPDVDEADYVVFAKEDRQTAVYAVFKILRVDTGIH